MQADIFPAWEAQCLRQLTGILAAIVSHGIESPADAIAALQIVIEELEKSAVGGQADPIAWIDGEAIYAE